MDGCCKQVCFVVLCSLIFCSYILLYSKSTILWFNILILFSNSHQYYDSKNTFHICQFRNNYFHYYLQGTLNHLNYLKAKYYFSQSLIIIAVFLLNFINRGQKAISTITVSRPKNFAITLSIYTLTSNSCLKNSIFKYIF
jgi:hypothetical protein